MSNRYTLLKAELLRPNRNFTISEAGDIVNEINELRLIDTKERFHNTFFHEICPLLLIAAHVGDKATTIRFTGSDSRFDGLIFRGGENCGQIIEMTSAIDGYNDALQMELLEQRGHAPALQVIQAEGNKRNRKFGSNKLKANRDYDQRTLLPLLKTALSLKKEKAPKNPHYTNAWLGIVFEDWNCPGSENENKERFDPICKKAFGNDPERYAPFARVFFVGISRQYIFDSCEAI